MDEGSPNYQRFFAELKRRRVFRVMAVYGIVGFVLLQVVDLVVPALLLPEWTYRLVALILLLGFPVAIVLAWAFEMTPDGVQRTGEAEAGEIEAIVAQPASKRWPAGLMALVGVAALVLGAWWVGRQTAPGVGSDSPAAAAGSEIRFAFADLADDPRPSIAVLPFEDMSPEGDQEYFSDGMTEEILNVLAKVRDLRVSARTSTFALKDHQLTAAEWGDTLRVEYLLEGSVRKADDQLRITAQLIRTADGSHLWSERYDRTLDNVFQIQTDIAEAIAAKLTVPLGLDDPADLVTPTADLEAYDLYLAGRARMRERGQSVFEAARLFEAALARDSNWAPAWAGLAESQALFPYYAPGPDDPPTPPDSAYWARHLEAAEVAASRALELDPSNASATVALANVLRDRWNWEAAEAAYIRALTLDPDNVEAHQEYAEYLIYLGRADEALDVARRALALDRSPIRLDVAGYISSLNGFYDEGIELLSEGIRLDPDGRIHWLRSDLFRAYVSTGRWTEAREVLLELMAEFAPEHLAEIREAFPTVNAVPTTLDADLLRALPDGWVGAQLWMELGEPDKALALLEAFFLEDSPFGLTVGLWHPSLDPLRDNPRFEAILRRRGLEGRRPVRAASAEADGSR